MSALKQVPFEWSEARMFCLWLLSLYVVLFEPCKTKREQCAAEKVFFRVLKRIPARRSRFKATKDPNIYHVLDIVTDFVWESLGGAYILPDGFPLACNMAKKMIAVLDTNDDLQVIAEAMSRLDE